MKIFSLFYLEWTEAHFYDSTPSVTFSKMKYPLTWEAYVSEADYDGMRIISEEYVENKICTPHSWHIAEAFLYLLEIK